MKFYATPQEIKSEVFVSIVDSLHLKERSNRWTDEYVGHATHSFLEGPAFGRDGNLYVVNFAFGQIIRVTPRGDVAIVAEYDGAPNGLQVHRNGYLYISDRQNGIVRVNPNTGSVEVVCDVSRMSPNYQGLSDLTFSMVGDLYFTDQGQSDLAHPTGRLLRLAADGHVDVLLDSIPGPNGVVLNPKETHVFVAVTYGPAVWRANITKDGSIRKVGVYQYLSGGYSGADGLAMDRDGGLAVCHNRLGTVWLFDPMGEPSYRIRAPKGTGTKITNLAYGGKGNSKIFMTETESGAILVADAPVPGALTFGQT